MSRKPLLQRLHESDPDLFKSISKLILLHLTKTAIVNCSTGSDGQIECASRLIEIDKQRALINADIADQQKIVDVLLATRSGAINVSNDVIVGGLSSVIGYHPRRSRSSSKIPPPKKP